MVNKKQVIFGASWSLIERVVTFVATTVISIVLARILSPTEYGNIALVSVFVNIFTNVLLTGLGTSLVQKKAPEEIDYSTIFCCNAVLSIISYLILFFSAPAISIFYGNNELTIITRTISIMIPFAAISSVHFAYLQKTMQFKKYCIVTVLATLISGISGIVAAYCGLGIWALIIYHVGRQLLQSVLLIIVCKFHFKIRFSKKSASELLPFGLKTMATTFIGDLEADVRSLIIGKTFSSADLAYYNQGSNYPKAITTNVGTAINRVVFPMFSSLQEDKEKLKDSLRKAISINMFLLVPVLVGLLSIADTFVLVLYTDKWVQAIPFVQIICIAFLMRPYENICQQALLGIGKSNIVMYDMIITKTISMALIMVAVFAFKSVIFLAWGTAITSVVGVLLYLFQVKHFFNYSIKEQIRDVFPSLFASGTMLVVVVKIKDFFVTSNIVLLFVQIAVGALVYFVFSILFDSKPLKDTLDLAKNNGFLNKNRVNK